jgi:hypothetical protein
MHLRYRFQSSDKPLRQVYVFKTLTIGLLIMLNQGVCGL